MTAAAGAVRHPPLIRAPGPLRRFRGPMLSGLLAVRRSAVRGDRPPQAPSALAAASIAASDFRTWLRSVVYQKSGSDAFR